MSPLCITELRSRFEAALACAIEGDFGREWCKEHMADDHLVTIDHKDERLLAELVLCLLGAE